MRYFRARHLDGTEQLVADAAPDVSWYEHKAAEEVFVFTTAELAEHNTRVKTETLRDAANEAQIRLGSEVSGHTSTYSVRQWLHARARRIERGE